MEKLMKGDVFMTKTIQPRSWITLNEEGKDLTINKPDKDESVRLLITLCDSVNELYEKLNRLSHVIGKKIEERNLSQESK